MWDDIVKDGWYFRVVRGTTGYTGLAKQSPFVNGDPILEPGDIWFNFGASWDEALEKIQREVFDPKPPVHD